MSKYLKKSYIIESFNLYIIRFILKVFCKPKFNKEKVLVKSCDGIGDILVKVKVGEAIIKKYGKENVYFLFQNSYRDLGELLGYKTIGLTRKERKNIFYRLKKMWELNNMGFTKYINLEFTNDITTGNILAKERVGRNDYHSLVKRYNKYYTKGYDIEDKYVLEQVKDIYENILNKKISLEDIIPNIKISVSEKIEEYRNSIVVAVGSTDRKRVCSPKIMGEYLKVILEKYPKKNILLVGNGDRQKEYANYIENILRNNRIKNLVNRTKLKEVFEIVSCSEFFIGFDSGLYNACYAMRKKGIILFKNKNGGFYHEVPWLHILTPKSIREDIIDEIYDDKEINSIDIKDFEEALKKLI